MALIETTPAKEDYRRKMAYRLMAEASDANTPVLHWAQGLAKLGQGALGGYQMYLADQRDKETEAANYSGLAAALERFGGGAPAAAAQPSPQRPTVTPSQPVTSVTPSAGAVPAMLAADVPAGKVMPKTETNPNGGMYGGLNWRPVDSESPPEPVKTAALSPAAAPVPAAAPAVPTPTAPEMDAAKAKLSQMVAILRDPNVSPAEKKTTAKMAEMLAGNLFQGDKPTDDIREFQYGQKNPAFNEYMMNKRKAGATNVTTNVGGGSDKQIFDTMDESAKAARTTAAGLTGLREAKAAIEGGAITGFRADDRLSLQKAGAFFGVADPSKIVNTETFKAAIAPQVAAVLKSTVGTANISNTDREFAEKAAGGNINLDEGSIKRLLDIMERASVGQLESHQKRLDKVYSDPEKFARERALFGVDMPAAPVRVAPATPDRDALKKKYNLK